MKGLHDSCGSRGGRLSRRRLIGKAGTAIAGLIAGCAQGGQKPNADEGLPKFTVRSLTRGPKHHFFGYYGIPPWNAQQSHLLSLEVPFQDRMPSQDERATIGLVDANGGSFRAVTETNGWNFQQGAMLHWLPVDANRYFLFNNREPGSEVYSEVFDLATRETRRLPRPVNGVARSKPYALSLNYGRLTRMRPVVGYPGLEDSTANDAHPAHDGVWVMDLNSGATHLAVSIDAVYQRIVRHHPWVEGQHMWFNHVVFNPSAERFFFLARVWKREDESQLESAMFTANRDGSEVREVVPFGKSVSHFEWRNDREILATFEYDTNDRQHVLFFDRAAEDGGPEYKVVAREFFKGDGHCSFAPGGDWIVTDRNNTKSVSKELRIYSLSKRKGLFLGEFAMREKRYLSGDLRCDLHPRWSRDGKQICFDALDAGDGSRQMHLVDLAWS